MSHINIRPEHYTYHAIHKCFTNYFRMALTCQPIRGTRLALGVETVNKQTKSMKKILLAVLVAASVATFQASALIVTVDKVSGYSGGDGEFNVSPITGSGYGAADLYKNNVGDLGFGTFCINRSVYINIPGQYNATVYQNGIDPNNGNQISLGTAWLFIQFAGGSLSGYNYTPGAGRASSSYQLQLAIWILEGQYPLASIIPGSDPFLNAAIAQFGTLVGAEADNNQKYGVGVLGLTTVTPTGGIGSPVQPMLTLLPDGGSVLILLGMGLSGLAVFARKFRA
jgi:hypothetical protein